MEVPQVILEHVEMTPFTLYSFLCMIEKTIKPPNHTRDFLDVIT